MNATAREVITMRLVTFAPLSFNLAFIINSTIIELNAAQILICSKRSEELEIILTIKSRKAERIRQVRNAKTSDSFFLLNLNSFKNFNMGNFNLWAVYRLNPPHFSGTI
jgi:hypothetical protein